MRKEKKIVHQQVTESWITEYTCDACGRNISRDDPGEGCAHELLIGLDSEECVNFYRRRDLCPACLEPIWAAINKLLGADPDTERDKEYD